MKLLRTRRAVRAESDTAAPVAVGAPAGRYDTLTVEAVLAHLGELTPTGLAALADHERAHQNRAAVLAAVAALLGDEPWPGYDELDVPGVRTALESADREQLGSVLAYERTHKNRAGVVLATQQGPAQDPG